MPLTDTAIRKAKPEAKQRKLYDERGLFLLVSPKGDKWWRFKYQFDGKEELLSLSTYPDTSLKDARERRGEARKQVAAGIDPGEHRKARKTATIAKQSNSFEVVAREWYAKHSPNWSPMATGSSAAWSATSFPGSAAIPSRTSTRRDCWK